MGPSSTTITFFTVVVGLLLSSVIPKTNGFQFPTRQSHPVLFGKRWLSSSQLSSSPSGEALSADSFPIGETLPPLLDDCVVTRVSVENAEEGVCRYRVKATVDGSDVKGLYQVILGGAKKKAAYPGHRKGVIPNFKLPEILRETLDAALKDATRSTVMAYAMVNFPQDMRTYQLIDPPSLDILSKNFKLGDPLVFEAEIDGIGVPSLTKPKEAPPADKVPEKSNV